MIGILIILLAHSIPASAQEEEEPQDPLINTTILHLTSEMELIPKSSESGSIQAPNFRLITGGGSREMGEWSSSPVLGTLTIGGTVSIDIYVTGSGTGISLSSSFLVNDDILGSEVSGEKNLISGGTVFTMTMDIPDTVLQTGDTVSVSLEFSATVSRGVDLVFGNPSDPSTVSFDSGSLEMSMEVHLHDGELHLISSLVPAFGPDSISSVSATITGSEDSVEADPTSIAYNDGKMDYEWEINEFPSGDLKVTISIADSSGNIYNIESEAHADQHDHSHGEIVLTSGNLMILAFVLAGIMGVGYIGGITPLHSFFDEKKMRFLLAFSGGIFIATAIFHALPEALEMSGWISLLFVGIGFGTLYVIEHFVIGIIDRKFRNKNPIGHSHDHSGIQLHLHDHHSKDHKILTDKDVDPEDQVCSHHMNESSEAAFFGVSIHNFVEGIVITTLFLNPFTQGVGLIVILATILHKAPCTFSIASLLKMGGRSRSSIKKMVLIVLAMTPIGALLAILLFIRLDMFFVGLALAFSAGTFLEIGLLDIIPESIREKKGRWWAVAAIGVGLALLWLFSLVHVH